LRKQPAVFLDRDGVINQDSWDFIKCWDEFRFRPEVLPALERLHRYGVEVYLITNQSGVGRGYLSERTLLDILTRMRLVVSRSGGLIHGISWCPHAPDDGCFCRKPAPGQLLVAAAKYGLDLGRSVMVGDSCGDVNAAHAAGCQAIFVTTRSELPRNPNAAADSPDEDYVAEHLGRCVEPPNYTCATLAEAVEIILDMPQFGR
jgi:D-glycero-D-manno-heptose 1,7-bisphosphate phosphatase